MSLQQAPWTNYRDRDEEGGAKDDTFTVRLNPDQRSMLESSKEILNQSKDSTATKQLATIGAYVLHDPKTRYILDVVFNNKRKNKERGIVDFE